jgi:uncharacterized protein (TIGR03083 family)
VNTTDITRTDPVTFFADALRRDGARLAAGATDLTLRVPSCPEWVVGDLVWHVGEVHEFWREIAKGAQPTDLRRRDRPLDHELVPWFRDGVEAIAATLENLDPARPSWTWSSQRDVGFIQRRMAHETAVHCWDVLSAAGRDEPVERALAEDGIDEFLSFFLPDTAPEDLDVHLHATDGSGEWLIRSRGTTWRIGHEHAKAAAAVRGSASDLLLFLWRRKPSSAVETFGDAAMLNRLRKAASLG